MAKLINVKIKYIVLLLSLIFMAFSINSLKGHIFEIGLRPSSNITADKMTGEEEFLLYVKKPAEVFLLHNAKIASGYIKFTMTKDDGKIVENYKFSSDNFINKVIKLDKGTYYCTIIRDVKKDKERFRLYFDRRFVTQEYIKNDSSIENFTR